MKALIPSNDSHNSVIFAEVPEPEPAPDEAVIEVEAFSINRGETFLLEAPKPNWRPGKDISGRVIRAAQTGTGPAAGTRVVGHPPSHGWAQYAAVPVARMTELPDTVDTIVGAALPLPGLTALRLLRVVDAIFGRRILITGASGGVGHAFVELAAAGGAHIYAVVATPERGRRLLELGAAELVFDVADAPDSMDIVLESVGGASLTTALSKLVPRGKLIWFGQAGRKPATIDFFSFFDGHRSATIRHFHYEDSDISDAVDLSTLVRLVATGRLHPEIDRVSPWEETAARIADLRARAIRGNTVLQL